MEQEIYKEYNGKSVIEDISGDAQSIYDEYKEKLMEVVAETSDELTEKYFAEGELPMEDVLPALRNGILNKSIIPLMATDAYHNIGIDAMLNFIVEYGPSPEDMSYKALKGEEEIGVKVSGPFAGLAFKTSFE